MRYSVVDVQRRIIERYEIFRKNYEEYVETIKKYAEEFFSKDLKEVIVFGSFAEKKHKPYSDIDVAVVLRKYYDEVERAKFVNLINKKFGINPFEIHVVDEETWKNFYSKFVKKYIKI